MFKKIFGGAFKAVGSVPNSVGKNMQGSIGSVGGSVGMVSFLVDDAITAPLFKAVEEDDVIKVIKLLDGGSTANCKRLYIDVWETPLHVAIKKKSVAMIRLLLEKGAKSNPDLGKNSKLPLQLAKEMGCSKEIEDLLIKYGAETKDNVTNCVSSTYEEHGILKGFFGGSISDNGSSNMDKNALNGMKKNNNTNGWGKGFGFHS